MIDILELNHYQYEALRTVNRDLNTNDQLVDGLMGLNGEAGECIDILKKHLYQGHSLNYIHLKEELGDVLWYLAVSANALGYSLEEIAKTNINKLRKRYPNGFEERRSVNRGTEISGEQRRG